MHKSIFQMVTYGKGGWTYETLYEMPVRMRMLYMKWMVEAINRENEAAKPKHLPKKVYTPPTG